MQPSGRLVAQEYTRGEPGIYPLVVQPMEYRRVSDAGEFRAGLLLGNDGEVYTCK